MINDPYEDLWGIEVRANWFLGPKKSSAEFIGHISVELSHLALNRISF